ncbi:MAG: hypothetical protein KGL95_07950 [Patescibacteria group bacterium]|nr:hypothetical protein [Patescibacteria group bacterium]
MKLVRFVLFTFSPPQTKWKYTEFNTSSVQIRTFATTRNKIESPETLVVQAETTLNSKPELTDKNTIIIPEVPRKEMEQVIEYLANIISVSEMCQRTISSPAPCIAFRPENKEELDWLNGTKGIPHTLQSNQEFRFSLQNEFQQNSFLSDRLDGVTMMAEALSCSHLTGKLHEFMRLFERAFTLSSKPLIKPLSDFLMHSKVKITIQDVAKWIVELRHPATHADRKDQFVSESDIRPYIYLIEQAAYDVLFNKLNWRDTSATRRDVYRPIAGVGNDKSGFIQQNSMGLTFQTQMLDPFGSYPFDLSGALTTLPQELWFKKFEEE